MTTTLETPAPPAPDRVRSPGARALAWTGGIVGAVLVLGGAWSVVGWLQWASGATTTSTATSSYAAEPVVRLVADGDVALTRGEPGQVVVKRTAQELGHRAAYSVERAGGTLVIRHTCDWWSPGGHCSASLDARVPQGTHVVVESTDGDVRAIGFAGDLTVELSDGNAKLNLVEGAVRLAVTDGYAEIARVEGSVHATARDGALTVADVSGDVTTSGVDADTTISGVGGNVVANGRDGDVTVFGDDEPVALSLEVADGRRRVDGPTDPAASRSVRIEVRDGNGSYL